MCIMSCQHRQIWAAKAVFSPCSVLLLNEPRCEECIQVDKNLATKLQVGL